MRFRNYVRDSFKIQSILICHARPLNLNVYHWNSSMFDKLLWKRYRNPRSKFNTNLKPSPFIKNCKRKQIMLFSLLVVSALLATSVNADLDISVCGRYGGGAEVFDESAAEIVAFDATSGLLLVTNAFTSAVDVLDISDPTTPTLVKSLNDTGLGPNSVTVYDGLAAVALEADVKQEAGSVAFYDMTTDSGTYLGSVEVSIGVGNMPSLLLLWNKFLNWLLFYHELLGWCSS